MKRDRASSEEEAEAGKDVVERRAEGRGGRPTEPAVDGSNTPGLRVHEWGLNPLFWSYVKLLIRDLHGLGTLGGIDDSHVLH
ncbi:unnamed protein product, partial [Ectocarpus sp. 12 AP-2014]